MPNEQQIKFRLADWNDRLELLQWRNDVLTQKMSHHIHPIALHSHEQWFTSILQSTTQSLYICYRTRENKTENVGQIRKDDEVQISKLSWTINPAYRGMGLGKRMLTAFISLYPANYYAEIKTENIASQKICEYAGFTQVDIKNNIFVYKNICLDSIIPQ